MGALGQVVGAGDDDALARFERTRDRDLSRVTSEHGDVDRVGGVVAVEHHDGRLVVGAHDRSLGHEQDVVEDAAHEFAAHDRAGQGRGLVVVQRDEQGGEAGARVDARRQRGDVTVQDPAVPVVDECTGSLAEAFECGEPEKCGAIDFAEGDIEINDEFFRIGAITNPIAQILSAAMMLRFSFGQNEAADAIDAAVKAAIDDGFRTGDIHTGAEGTQKVGTAEMGDAIVARLG